MVIRPVWNSSSYRASYSCTAAGTCAYTDMERQERAVGTRAHALPWLASTRYIHAAVA